jgi:acetylornithine/succinyldiaminopimelate/putrescine aminotransferase
LLNCTHDTVLRLLPPFILTTGQAEAIVGILDEVFDFDAGGPESAAGLKEFAAVQ